MGDLHLVLVNVATEVVVIVLGVNLVQFFILVILHLNLLAFIVLSLRM